jgi:BirA family transcriptional regulator, biotin operon repressor / biotin---[acetyl-CoA-carboxylase] ligase
MGTVPAGSAAWAAARGPLRADAVRDAVTGGPGGPGRPGGLWTSVEVVASTGSTNADLLARGGPEGQVLVAEEQTAGRGRAGRTWVSAPGASLTFSVLLRPTSVPPAARGWLPLLTGVAVAAAIRSAATGVAAVLKWPNDVLVGDRKLAGILAEQSPAGDAVVVGVGLNVATPQVALPVSPNGLPATSLLVEGAEVAREPLLTEILRGLERWYLAFRADPDPERSGLLAEYTAACATLGRTVRVELPAGRVLTGVAEGVDRGGRLLVRPAEAASATPVSAGDIVHLR